MTSQLKSLFLGNITTKTKIVDVPYSKKDFKEINNKIFNKVTSSQNTQIGHTNKFNADSDSCVYFTLKTSNILYILITDKNYPEYEAFRLVDFLHDKNIYSYLNEHGELSKEGINLLKSNVNDYVSKESSHNTMTAINNDISDIKDTMKSNLREVLRTTDDAKSLEVQSSSIKLEALEYQDNAKELKKVTCIQNWKWTIIICLIVGIVAGILIYSLT